MPFACCLLVVAVLIVSSCVTITPSPATVKLAEITPAATKPAKTLQEPYEIAVVVKIAGVPWFNVMEDGVKQAAQELGVNAYTVGPTGADPAQQVNVVEDLVAKRVDAIAVVPNDAKSLESIFKKASDKGIIVLTQESVNQVGNDYDLELVDNVKFAQRHWDALVKCMGTGEAEYAILIGSQTETLHNLWADAGLKYAKEKYPELKLVTDPIPSAGDQALSRQKVLQLIKTYPNLKGVIGFGTLGPPGAAQAVKEMGLENKVCVVGTVVPSHAAPFLKDGSLDQGYLWNPKDAGYGLVWLAKQILDGQKIETGMEIPGLGPITVDGKIIRTNSIIAINKDNVDSFGF